LNEELLQGVEGLLGASTGTIVRLADNAEATSESLEGRAPVATATK